MKNLSILILCLIIAIPTFADNYETKSLEELKIAFARDNYEVVKVITFQGKRGLKAEHKSATNYEHKIPKRAYYVEGNAYEMGYLLGALGHDHLEKMATDYIDKVIFDFINIDLDPKKEIPIIWAILKSLAVEMANVSKADMSKEHIDEMKGLIAGCQSVNPLSEISVDDLVLLNVGIDVILARVYALNKLPILNPKTGKPIDPKKFSIPVMCNAFSVFGKATTDGKHYFGRDFMFPTAGIFDYAGCMTVYFPNDGRVPFVSVHAPGMIGAPAGMNIEGIGAGVDMVAGNNCSPKRPGINSLLMIRNVMDQARSAQEALDTIIDTQRGVTWLYVVADGKNDRSFVAESGRTVDKLDFVSFPNEDLKKLKMLPDREFLERHETEKFQKGVMARWNDYKYPKEFFKFNGELFKHHGKKQTAKSWGERGFINDHWKTNNTPETYYFSPQRENRDDVLIVTNQFTIPSMRLCAMQPYSVLLAALWQDDVQWRYDELNEQVLKSYGQIDEAKAIELINFLNCHGKFPKFYEDSKDSSDKKTKVVRGSISLCNLTDKVIHTLTGWYKDEWTTITLGNYIGQK